MSISGRERDRSTRTCAISSGCSSAIGIASRCATPRRPRARTSARRTASRPTTPESSRMIAPAGLTSAEAARRLAAVGPNEPAPVARASLLAQIARPFANPLVLILLVASAVSASLGQRADALIIAGIILVSTSIDFAQTHRSQRAAERLRALVTPTATVLRDGRWCEMARRDVVPGDLFRLCAGDLVPADARLVEARNLSVHQAMLTGESLPVDKDVCADVMEPLSAGDRGAVFLGTSVVSGTATALVVATGPRTLFGEIATRLRSRAPETEFDRGL